MHTFLAVMTLWSLLATLVSDPGYVTEAVMVQVRVACVTCVDGRAAGVESAPDAVVLEQGSLREK